MSAEERKKILQMVAEGRINAEEAATLMRALEENTAEEIRVTQPQASSRPQSERFEEAEKSDTSDFEEVRKRARRFAMIPLWIGVLLTTLSAWGMFLNLQNSGYNFWFFCLGMPLLLGILLTAMGAASGTARWVYLNVDRSHQDEWPRHITLAFPLPLGLVSWFLQNFGSRISRLKRTNVDDVIHAISLTRSIKEPLIINVDDSDDGERVQVYIG